MIPDILNTIFVNVLCDDIILIVKLNLICKNMYDSVHNYLSTLDNKNDIYNKIYILKKCVDDPEEYEDRALQYNYIDIIQFRLGYMTREVISNYCIYFVRNNNINIVKNILKNTIIKKSDIHNALYYACILGHTDILRVLIENNEQRISLSIICSCIAEADVNDKPDVIYLLLEKYGDNNIGRAKIKHAMDCAIRHNRMDIIQLMIDKNLKIDSHLWYFCLLIAVSRNYDGAINIVKFIIDKCALSNLNDYDWIIYHSIESNNIDIVKLIIQTYIINKKKPISKLWWKKILRIALKYGNIDIIELLSNLKKIDQF